MAITQTNLSAAMAAADHSMSVASGTGFPTTGAAPVATGYLTRIDKEYMLSIQQPATGIISVIQRGYLGTAASAHDTLAKVEVSAVAGDFAGPVTGNMVPLPDYIPNYNTLGQDTTFTAAGIAALGNQPQNYAITKATAIAVTLVAPNKSQDGLTLTFTSLTDQLHAITATSLLANGGASSPYTTATMANAKAGGGLTLQAQNGLWNVIAATNWTLS